jgi:hypothetical protein
MRGTEEFGAAYNVQRTRSSSSVFQSKDEPGGTEKARIVMAPLWVDLRKESRKDPEGFLILILILGLRF